MFVQWNFLFWSNGVGDSLLKQEFVAGVQLVPMIILYRIELSTGVVVILLRETHGVHGSAEDGALRHDDRAGQRHLHAAAGDQPCGVGFHAEGVFREDGSPFCHNFILQGFVCFGMGDVQSRSDDGQGRAACIEAAPMGSGVAA